MEFVCPACHTWLVSKRLDTQCCPLENTEYREINGSWRLLTSEATERLSKFIESYEAVRSNEGRGSSDPQFYRSLPYPSGLDRRWLRHWKQRADSYEKLLRQVIEPCEAPLRHLTVLDLGAGNGWLSNRLAERGHTVIAVDLQTNDFDGLGCRKYYATDWVAVQAEFDRLPIADRSIDLVIFNASLHYAESLERTLGEALRVLRPSGAIAILDSPIYNSERSGRKMLSEQPFSNGVSGHIGFFTWSGLNAAAHHLDLTAEFTLSPRTFSQLAVRTLKRLYLRREPAQFGLIVLHR